MKRDFSQYACSLSSLDWGMRYFDIHYTDNINVTVTVEQIRDAVKKEVDSPGKLLTIFHLKT